MERAEARGKDEGQGQAGTAPAPSRRLDGAVVDVQTVGSVWGPEPGSPTCNLCSLGQMTC